VWSSCSDACNVLPPAAVHYNYKQCQRLERCTFIVSLTRPRKQTSYFLALCWAGRRIDRGRWGGGRRALSRSSCTSPAAGMMHDMVNDGRHSMDVSPDRSQTVYASHVVVKISNSVSISEQLVGHTTMSGLRDFGTAVRSDERTDANQLPTIPFAIRHPGSRLVSAEHSGRDRRTLDDEISTDYEISTVFNSTRFFIKRR